jgi:multidrug transporter EmrE-like cation transporter
MTGTSTLVAVLLAVGGGVLYHVAAKSIPKELAPAPVLVVAYATALAISGVAHLWLSYGGAVSNGVSGAASGAASLRLFHPAVLGLGVGAALIELGYVLMYRAAWPVSTASQVVNGMVVVLLVLVGLALFGERLSSIRVAGLLLCLGGVWLLRH